MESREEVLNRTRRRINAAKARLNKTWKDVLARCDKDNSGFLDYKELEFAVRTELNVPENAICQYELRTLFKAMDADSSGGVNIEELLNYLAQGFRTPQEIAARAQVRIQRVRKNLKTAFQTVATNESNMRKLFSKLDMDSDASLSLYEFKTFVRMNLKLSFWDVNNTDIEEFYVFLDKNGQGISVEELMAFVKTNNGERPKEFSFLEGLAVNPNDTRCKRKKTFKQTLLEDSFRSTSLPNLSRLPYTSTMVGMGRNCGPRGRNSLDKAAQQFFNPGSTS